MYWACSAAYINEGRDHGLPTELKTGLISRALEGFNRNLIVIGNAPFLPEMVLLYSYIAIFVIILDLTTMYCGTLIGLAQNASSKI